MVGLASRSAEKWQRHNEEIRQKLEIVTAKAGVGVCYAGLVLCQMKDSHFEGQFFFSFLHWFSRVQEVSVCKGLT